METWTCAACGYVNSDMNRRCGSCQAGRPGSSSKVYSRPPDAKKPDVASVSLPLYIPDARFATGSTWTQGGLYAVAEGWFLLSEKDNLADPAKARDLPIPISDSPELVAPLSQWVPTASIEKVLHSASTGFCIVARGQKIPLRLSTEGWARLAGVCHRVGVGF